MQNNLSANSVRRIHHNFTLKHVNIALLLDTFSTSDLAHFLQFHDLHVLIPALVLQPVDDILEPDRAKL